MRVCLFASDLHGRTERYEKLFRLLEEQRPALVALGGDLPPISPVGAGFLDGYLRRRARELRRRLKGRYPSLLLILGNDDPRSEEAELQDGEREGLWLYLHNRRVELFGRTFFDYACIPPSPFLLKDWERYDISRHVDPGCLSLEEALFLFHAPPYRTSLDQAALHRRQPLVSLHGHVHEPSRLSGSWRDRLGRTYCYSAAWNGPELAVVRFDLERPAEAERLLL